MIWFIKNMYRVYFVHVHEKVFNKFILNKYYIFTSGFWSWPSLATISTLASSTFYRELLQYFQEFKNKTKLFSYGNFLLWNNEAITIEKKMLLWKSWFEKKIFFIQDILNGDGNFLTFEEFQNKFITFN